MTHVPKRYIALLAMLSALSIGQSAHAGCGESVSAVGRAANPMNYDPPKQYDVEKMARARAIAAWQSAAHSACAKASPEWAKASGKTLDCEGYAGGLECKATAIPHS